MKRLLNAFALFVMAAFFAMPTDLFAQAADTLDIAALPPGNINTITNGDTLVGQFRAHPNRVYRLKRGSVYQVTAPMPIKGNFKLIATSEAGVRPPVLAPAIRTDNSSIDWFFSFSGKGSKVELHNIYLLSFRADGAQLGWSSAMGCDADSVTLKMRGVIMDGFSANGIGQNAHWAKMDIQDCKFRNFQHGTSYFGGQPMISGGKIHSDTIKFINNTFFANNSYIWSIRGYDRYSEFSHNTVVYGMVNPFLTRTVYNMHMNNNLFYASHAYGGIPEHIRDGWFLNYPDTNASSILFIRAKTETVAGNLLVGIEGNIDSAKGVTAPMLALAGRTIEVKNNVYKFPTALQNFYKAYNDTVKTIDSLGGVPYKRTLTMAKWVNDYTQNNITNVMPAISPKTTVVNNTEGDPGFSTAVANHITEVIGYVKKIATNTLDKPWFFQPSGSAYPPVWPLPEDLAYTNTTMQKGGTDGFAVGDLNWFPTQKSAWLLTGVEDENFASVPGKFELAQNYPNPFNPSTTMNFTLKANSLTTLKVYNIIGQEVATLVNGVMTAGSHQVTFDASRLSSGVYFYTLRSGSFVETKKMTLMK